MAAAHALRSTQKPAVHHGTVAVKSKYSIRPTYKHTVYRRGPLNLAPFLYVTPRDLAPFGDLLLRLGVHETFTAQQFLSMLDAVHKQAAGKPLEATQLEQAISVVQVWSGHYLVVYQTASAMP